MDHFFPPSLPPSLCQAAALAEAAAGGEGRHDQVHEAHERTAVGHQHVNF